MPASHDPTGKLNLKIRKKGARFLGVLIFECTLHIYTANRFKCRAVKRSDPAFDKRHRLKRQKRQQAAAQG